MRTYGVSMLQAQDKLVPVIMPFYTAEAQNTLERGSRPYSVVEILREVFKEDFFKAIQYYMEQCPEGAAKAIGIADAREFRLVWLYEPKVENSLHQPACTTAGDLIFRATVEALVTADEKAGVDTAVVMERRRLRMRCRAVGTPMWKGTSAWMLSHMSREHTGRQNA